MACGLPVAVSDIPSSMELIQYGTYGLFFETANPQDCAETIAKYVLNPDLCLSFGKNAQKRAMEFSATRMISDIENIYISSTEDINS